MQTWAKLQHNSSQILTGQFLALFGNRQTKSRIFKAILNNMRTAGGTTVSNFKLYYNAITSWYVHKIESNWRPCEIPHTFGYPNFYIKKSQKCKLKKRQHLQQMLLVTIWMVACIRIDSYWLPCTKLNSK